MLVPKGHTIVVCKNERQRSSVGGEVTVTLLKHETEHTFVFVIEDHVNGTIKASPILHPREIEVLKDVINDFLWKSRIR